MITKAASDTSNGVHPIRFTQSARHAWAAIIESSAAARAQRILLPAYIGYTDREGSGVFDPVQQAGVAYEFYRVHDDLSVDVNDFVSALDSGQITTALVIHYFGFCRTDMSTIRSECAARGVTLIEDCAHVLPGNWSRSALGTFGDFSFYSLHKHLPVTSGGLLRWRTPGRVGPRLDARANPPANVIEQFAITDFDRIAAAKRSNYAAYAAALSVDECEHLYALCENDVPQTFPIRVRGPKRREELYFHLMRNDMPTIALYYRLIDAIPRDAFPQSYALSDEILNLPVHQDTTPDDIARLCDAIRAFFRGSSKP